MANTWGKRVTLSIFGESHGPAIGIVIGGLPAGVELDFAFIQAQMQRRAPGRENTTPRKETDELRILSGLYNGKTTGVPLCAVIDNTDVKSGDYDTTVLRPGHADWPAFIKYNGHADMRGGGHFSGRLTAPLVFAGAIAQQILQKEKIVIKAQITQCGDVETAKNDGDSVGGVVECVAEGVPAGLGEPFFCGMESCIASLLFSIPAVKGVEFGGGFALAGMRGSSANDALTVENGQITAKTNHAGGIQGGITTGMPLVVRAAFKPTPTISLPQETVETADMSNVTHAFRGRHDPCIVLRAAVVVEAVVALAILEVIL
ncbi:MAG: chorismate synthase [Clostridia bacterium]|nr:chorismate synthase [Clostridia bacterium]